MKHLIFVVCIIYFWACANQAMSRKLSESFVAKIHEQWMSQYGRSYVDNNEKEKRSKIFFENLEFIENFNKVKNNTYKLGLNQFADLTTEEFNTFYTGLHNSTQTPLFSSNVASIIPINLTSIPSYLDWREYGAVTNVKSQGRCDSCSIFSAVAAVEGIVKIKTGNLISLSEQQLVDCTRQGCGTGWTQNIFNDIIQMQGITGEYDYPYQGFVERCREVSPAAQISGFVNVPPNDEEQLLLAVAHQPVSVGVSINQYFRFYKEGIFNGPCETNLNHYVTAIGYGISRSGTKYWLVKNSWGSYWGDGGYMWIERENGQPEGVCGIAMYASYPTI